MPIHDWTRMPSGIFHHFHQEWSIEIARSRNRGLLPKHWTALVEQRSDGREPDVQAIEESSRRTDSETRGLLTLAPPVTRMVFRTTNEIYAGRANRIVVQRYLGRTVAIIEIRSPGNKDSRAAVRDFVEKTVEFLRKGGGCISC